MPPHADNSAHVEMELSHCGRPAKSSKAASSRVALRLCAGKLFLFVMPSQGCAHLWRTWHLCQQECDYGAIVCFLPVPEAIGGRQLTATVIDLSPWVEYEFRVLASNTIGTGEPSKPSKQARTKGTCECLPSVCSDPFTLKSEEM